MLKKNHGAPALAKELLKMKLRELREAEHPVLRSTWPVIERLIARQHEMAPVWEELAKKDVTGTRLWVLTEQCIMAAVEGESGEHEAIRADHRELQMLNDEISWMSIKLAQFLDARDALLNRSGHFHVERMLRLTDFINVAGKGNYLYCTRIKPELENLSHYDLKYWPEMSALLHALGEERTEITFRYTSSEAIAFARPSLLTDFLRDLFDRICDISDGSVYGLRPGFRLSDASLGTICNVMLDLPGDEVIDAEYVKSARQRLRKQGLSAAW